MQALVLSYYLYSTLGCHLCEEAKSLLTVMDADHRLQWEEIDIVEDPSLVEIYGVRIPVLRHLASGNELSWPFTRIDLQTWLTLHNRPTI